MAKADNSSKVVNEAAEAIDTKVNKSEIEKARKEGVLEAVREDAKAGYRYASDNGLGAGGGVKHPFRHDIMQYAGLLDLGVKAFEERVAEGSDNPVPEEKCAGLLELERSGRNRTPYVKALMKRLGVKSPYEITAAGPGYTNDVQPVTEL